MAILWLRVRCSEEVGVSASACAVSFKCSAKEKKTAQRARIHQQSRLYPPWLHPRLIVWLGGTISSSFTLAPKYVWSKSFSESFWLCRLVTSAMASARSVSTWLYLGRTGGDG